MRTATKAITAQYDILFIDLYGVVWTGKDYFPGVLETMKELRDDGKTLIIVSNSSITAECCIDIFRKRGLISGVHYDRMITSGELNRQAVLGDPRHLKYYTLGRPNPTIFEGSRYIAVSKAEEADFVYIGLPQKYGSDGVWYDMSNLDIYLEEISYIRKLGLQMLCANPDVKAFEGKLENPVVRPGAVVNWYQSLGGEVILHGKPDPLIFDFASEGLTTNKSRYLMIGDTPQTDILGANKWGCDSLLVRCGVGAYDATNAQYSSVDQYTKDLGIQPTYIEDYF